MNEKEVAHISPLKTEVLHLVSKLNYTYSLPIIIHIDEKLPLPLDRLAPFLSQQLVTFLKRKVSGTRQLHPIHCLLLHGTWP